jgi:hypothetical protein
VDGSSTALPRVMLHRTRQLFIRQQTAVINSRAWLFARLELAPQLAPRFLRVDTLAPVEHMQPRAKQLIELRS